VVAEDGEGVGCQSPGADMEDRGQELAGDFVHVGDHQKETLGGGVGGGEGARLQGAVQGAGGAAFGVHFNDFDGLSEDVFLAVSGPFVNKFRHG